MRLNMATLHKKGVCYMSDEEFKNYNRKLLDASITECNEAEGQEPSKCKRCLQNVGEGSVICIKTIKLKTTHDK